MATAGENVAGGGAAQGGEELGPTAALRLAWIWWIVLLLIPFFYFMATIWVLAAEVGGPRPTVGLTFFWLSLAWLLVAMPTSFMLRNYCFRGYWEGRPVEPRSYLKGMVTIWVAAEVGGLLAITGVLLSGQLLPCLLPAAVAFMLFTPFWPSGGAMFEPVGGYEDEEIYRYPR